MAKETPPILTTSHRLQALAARSFAGVMRTLPLGVAALLGRSISGTLHALDRRHRARVVEQMRAALGPELPDATLEGYAGEMYRHFGIMLAEFPRLPLITRECVDEIVDWGEDLKHVEAAQTLGRGVIYSTGHIGNWEACGFLCCLKGLAVGSIARPLNNPLLDAWVKGIRQSRGAEIWDKFGAVRHVLRVLKNKGGFGILGDQDAGKRGRFIPFFGRPASTIPTAAELAVRTGAPVVNLGMHRVSPMRFRFTACPPILPEMGADPEAEIDRILSRINLDLESIIRRAPAQWLWLHRRWKTQPLTAD